MTAANDLQPSTGLQQAMLLASLQPESTGAYLQQLLLTLPRQTEAPVFMRVANFCIQRHAGVMARFEFREGQLFQSRASRAAPETTPEVDLSGTMETREERLQDFLEADRLQPLPLLSERPLWRSRLLRFGDDDATWLWTHHHSLADAASYPLLITEIFRTYDGLIAGGAMPGAPAAPDFLDYLAWLKEQDWSAPKKLWRQRLTRTDAPTALPEVRTAAGSGKINVNGTALRLAIEVPAKLDQQLRVVCAESELTLNTLVIGACALWLGRMQGESKVVFAAMRAARKTALPDAANIIGPLVNTLPLVIDLPQNLSSGEWLRTVRSHWLELRALEHCSLAQISEWTGFGEGRLDLPLILNFQRARLHDQLLAAGLSPERCQARLFQTTNVPLLLEGYESPQLQLALVGQKNSISASFLRVAAAGISAALRAFAGEHQRSLGAIELLSADDEKILRESTRGPKIEPPGAPAQELIERQIRQHPDAIAIEDGTHKLTFGEFGKIAGRVAANIVELDGTGGIVAVLLPPSSEILCAMLGSMRAGAAFLLINPELPVAERAAMLRRLSVTLVIAAPEVVVETQESVQRVFRFDQISAANSGKTSGSPEISPHDLAYLVHTSGSTGEKKFVEVEHFSLADTLSAMVRLYQYQPGDRRLSMGSPGNDYFIGELLVALSGGGTIVFPRRTGALSISEYLAQLHEERITVSGIPAAYWHEWVRAMDEDRAPDLPPALRLVICSMEKANPQSLAKWLRLIGARIRWLNVYGPAEATVAVTAWDPAQSPHDEGGSNLPIGRPFGNSEMYVLDRERRRVPIGICGEIGIAGPPVARGYRDLEAATREKFVENPFATAPEFSRLYLTGDYGYLNERGDFVFLGRRDQQVKIRGYRIELGEVEAALHEYWQIEHTAVTAEGEDGERRLVAHIVPQTSLDSAAFRNWMRHRFAPQLRPADFVTLERLPIMPTGKIDRRALSAAYRARAKSVAIGQGVNATEDKLLALWAELLGQHQFIERHDNFFDLGGNSLLAVRLLSRVEKDFDVSLSLHDLFSNPTVEKFAPLLERESIRGDFRALIRLSSDAAGAPLFVVHGWSGGVFHFLDLARRLEGTRPVFGLQAVEHAGATRHQTFEEMAKHYADELQRAHPHLAYELFGHSVGGMIAYATACELLRRGETVRRLYLVDTEPMNLPFRVHLKRILAQARPRFWPHLKNFLRTPARERYDFFRARRNAFKISLRQWPARANPRLEQLPPETDFYAVINRNFFPVRGKLEVKLFTPAGKDSMETYWRYLVGNCVENFFVTGGHVDMFDLMNLDNFMPAFRQASRP